MMLRNLGYGALMDYVEALGADVPDAYENY